MVRVSSPGKGEPQGVGGRLVSSRHPYLVVILFVAVKNCDLIFLKASAYNWVFKSEGKTREKRFEDDSMFLFARLDGSAVDQE